jgi:hypothetical protein
VIAYTVGSSQNCKRLLRLPALDGNDDDADVAFLRILLCELVLV